MNTPKIIIKTWIEEAGDYLSFEANDVIVSNSQMILDLVDFNKNTTQCDKPNDVIEISIPKEVGVTASIIKEIADILDHEPMAIPSRMSILCDVCALCDYLAIEKISSEIRRVVYAGGNNKIVIDDFVSYVKLSMKSTGKLIIPKAYSIEDTNYESIACSDLCPEDRIVAMHLLDVTGFRKTDYQQQKNKYCRVQANPSRVKHIFKDIIPPHDLMTKNNIIIAGGSVNLCLDETIDVGSCPMSDIDFFIYDICNEGSCKRLLKWFKKKFGTDIYYWYKGCVLNVSIVGFDRNIQVIVLDHEAFRTDFDVVDNFDLTHLMCWCNGPDNFYASFKCQDSIKIKKTFTHKIIKPMRVYKSYRRGYRVFRPDETKTEYVLIDAEDETHTTPNSSNTKCQIVSAMNYNVLKACYEEDNIRFSDTNTSISDTKHQILRKISTRHKIDIEEINIGHTHRDFNIKTRLRPLTGNIIDYDNHPNTGSVFFTKKFFILTHKVEIKNIMLHHNDKTTSNTYFELTHTDKINLIFAIHFKVFFVKENLEELEGINKKNKKRGKKMRDLINTSCIRLVWGKNDKNHILTKAFFEKYLGGVFSSSPNSPTSNNINCIGEFLRVRNHQCPNITNGLYYNISIGIGFCGSKLFLFLKDARLSLHDTQHLRIFGPQ